MKPTIKQFGDAALLVEFERVIDVEINRQVLGLREQLMAQGQFQIEFLTPAFCSLTIGFDPLVSSAAQLIGLVQQLSVSLNFEKHSQPKVVRIPVCYDLEFGLDLVDVARKCGMSVKEVVQTHQRPTYHAYMLGFLPGFAYLGSVDDSILVNRKANPRTEIPAGCVGLAGPQTGVYPCAAPGGWQIIGRTPIRMFDPKLEKGSLVEPGDQVEFFAIDRSQFDVLVRAEGDPCCE